MLMWVWLNANNKDASHLCNFHNFIASCEKKSNYRHAIHMIQIFDMKFSRILGYEKIQTEAPLFMSVR